MFCAREELLQPLRSPQTAYNITQNINAININYLHHGSEHIYKVIQAYDLSLHSNKDYWSRSRSRVRDKRTAAKRHHSVEGHVTGGADQSEEHSNRLRALVAERNRWFSKKDDPKSDQKTILELSKLPATSQHENDVKIKVAQMLGKMKHRLIYITGLWPRLLASSSMILILSLSAVEECCLFCIWLYIWCHGLFLYMLVIWTHSMYIAYRLGGI